MRGRDLFGKVEGSLNLLSKIYKILPNKYVEFRWNRVERWHGYLGMGIRYAIVKAKCKNCGRSVMIGPYVEIRSMDKLTIGAGTAINRGCYIDAYGGITIGDNVAISHSVSILSFNHDSQRNKN